MSPVRLAVEPVSDFGPCVLRGKDGRLTYIGAPEIILEIREDIGRAPDRSGNRPVVRGARRSTTLGEMLARRVITRPMHNAAVRFLDVLSLATGGSGSSFGAGVRAAAADRTAIPELQLRALTEARRVIAYLRIDSHTVFWWVVIGNRTPTEFDRQFRIREGTGARWLRASLEQLDQLYQDS